MSFPTGANLIPIALDPLVELALQSLVNTVLAVQAVGMIVWIYMVTVFLVEFGRKIGSKAPFNTLQELLRWADFETG